MRPNINFCALLLAIAATASAVTPIEEMTERRRDIRPAAARAMIEDLRTSHPERFREADAFLSRLVELEPQLTEAAALISKTAGPEDLHRAGKIFNGAHDLQREIALAHPLVKPHPILFVVREQYLTDHHNTETLFHTGEPNCAKYRPGGALKAFDPATGRVTTLVDPGPEGLARDPEIHFDGRRVLFSMRRARDENYSIYEVDINRNEDGSVAPGALRRLTNQPMATDIDPVYLPDERIVFSSTREPKYCHCNMHIMANLYRMDGDGANIHQISKNTLFDGHASLLPDGRVLYYRWEYVDRNFGDAQGLWTTNPDGTLHSIYWGNNTVSPAAVFDGRAIPGTDRVVSIFGSCHDRPWGAMAVLDRSRGIDSRDAVERIWPESARSLISIDGAELPSPFMVDYFRDRMRERYEDPFPLTDPRTGKGGTYFLVSRSVTPLPDEAPLRGSASFDVLRMGIYLVDTFGNEILLHEETPGCFDPMPLAPRARPPVIPDRAGYVGTTGVFFVDNVYEGQYMQGVGRGDVVALRVVESLEKRTWTLPNWDTGQFVAWRNGRRIQSGASSRPAISWAGFEVKRILGTVPVEADGSAHFEAPAGAFVYFQLLDKNGMAVSSMRSGAQIQPGETQGCIGCHENRLSSTHPTEGSMALRRPPSRMGGWHGAARPFNYAAEIQPIWDRHCVTCHDFGTTAGETLVLAGDRELIFNASYVELFRNWGDTNAWLNTVGLGLAPANPAYAVGSHRSRLVELLKRGHKNVALSADEMDRIVTWIDLGGPYYPDYASANPDHVAGRAPLTIAQTERLGELTGVPLINARTHQTGFGSHQLKISFDRPNLSPCLKGLDFDSDAYREALAILESGRNELMRNPEADRPGFIPCAEHQARETVYQTLREQERIRRAALAEGRKVYDPGIPAPGS